jgi:hypothetical protein
VYELGEVTSEKTKILQSCAEKIHGCTQNTSLVAQQRAFFLFIAVLPARIRLRVAQASVIVVLDDILCLADGAEAAMFNFAERALAGLVVEQHAEAQLRLLELLGERVAAETGADAEVVERRIARCDEYAREERVGCDAVLVDCVEAYEQRDEGRRDGERVAEPERRGEVRVDDCCAEFGALDGCGRG